MHVRELLEIFYARSETPTHFFLVCTAFAAHRTDLLQNLRSLEGFNVPNNIELATNRQKDTFTKLLITGSEVEEIDRKVFDIVHTYIRETKRFA